MGTFVPTLNFAGRQPVRIVSREWCRHEPTRQSGGLTPARPAAVRRNSYAWDAKSMVTVHQGKHTTYLYGSLHGNRPWVKNDVVGCLSWPGFVNMGGRAPPFAVLNKF